MSWIDNNLPADFRGTKTIKYYPGSRDINYGLPGRWYIINIYKSTGKDILCQLTEINGNMIFTCAKVGSAWEYQYKVKAANPISLGVLGDIDFINYADDKLYNVPRYYNTQTANRPSGADYGMRYVFITAEGKTTDTTAAYGLMVLFDSGGKIFMRQLVNGSWREWKVLTAAPI